MYWCVIRRSRSDNIRRFIFQITPKENVMLLVTIQTPNIFAKLYVMSIVVCIKSEIWLIERKWDWFKANHEWYPIKKTLIKEADATYLQSQHTDKRSQRNISTTPRWHNNIVGEEDYCTEISTTLENKTCVDIATSPEKIVHRKDCDRTPMISCGPKAVLQGKVEHGSDRDNVLRIHLNSIWINKSKG